MSSNGITFKVSDVKLEKIDKTSHEEFSPDVFNTPSSPDDDKETPSKEYLQGSLSKDLYSIGCHAFVHAAAKAYNEHHNLVIRPDDIWLAIITQFSAYVNNYPEELRDKFVDFEGKKELVVKTNGSLRTVSYDALAMLMADQIAENIKDPSIRDWALPSFSTTVNSDKAVGAVALMATLQAYFDYKFSLMCGLPQVTLLGSTSDWEEVRKRAERLVEFDLKEGLLKKWNAMLLPVLDQFIKSSKGDADKDWWNKIVNHVGGGSGPTWLSGWITVFCVFNDSGKWVGDAHSCSSYMGDSWSSEWIYIDTNDIPSGYVRVPVTVDDNGVEYKTTMYAGHLGVEFKDDNTIVPRLDWAIVVEKN